MTTRNHYRQATVPMIAFIRRFALHYGIYRRYPLARIPALKNAWRIART